MILLSIVLTFITVTVTTEIASDQSYIIINPIRQVARVGSTITLQCRVKVMEKVDVYWVKDGFGLGNSRSDIRQYGRPINNNFRYDLPFNVKEGEFDLRITDLELSDEGVFYCQVVVDGNGQSSQKATVQVLVSSEDPILIQRNNQGGGPKEEKSQTNPIVVNDGENLVIDCLANYGRPGAYLKWFVNDVYIENGARGGINGTFSGQITNSTSPSKKHVKLRNSISTLQMKINSLRHGNLLKCTAENIGFESNKLKPAIAQIQVHTTPIVKMEAFPTREGNTYIENDVIEFSCSAFGRPSTFSWKWYLDGRQVINIIANKYTLRISRSMHKKSLKCSATSTREGSTTVVVLVKYGPKFVNENTIMYAASIGETVTMSCKSDSNPVANVTWQRESSNEVISRGADLIRKNIQDEDFGIYRCTATAKGFSSVFKNSYLAKKRAPIIQQPSVSYGREGQSARLSCSIDSVPLPKDNEIKWIFNNKVISNSNRHKWYQDAFHGGVVTVLQILSLNAEDFGEYNCSVKTSLGRSFGVVILLNKGETPVLIIVGASIIFIFILLVITVVLCICKKKFKGDYEKGNPPSPEIPGQPNAKSTLIDSDCHCNPNLYSWIPQTLDLKENRDLLNKVHNQDDNLWTKASNMDSSYTNSLSGEYHNSKPIPMSNQENLRSNPLILNLQNANLNSSNKYSTNFPFATLALSQNVNADGYDQSHYPHYIYQEYCPTIGAQNVPNFHNNDFPSPVYLLKNNHNPRQRQFPSDYYPNSAALVNDHTLGYTNDCSANKFVSDYASNI